MKKIILSKIMNKIKKTSNYDEVKLEEIKYGLEAVYVLVTRTILFLVINLFLDNFKAFLIFTGAYILIRSYSFGFHASNSFNCILISSIGFVLIPYLGSIINFSFQIKIILAICFILAFVLWSPADTAKRPLVNQKNRLKLKVKSVFIVIIYSIIFLKLENDLSNILILTLIYQSVVISPVIYYLFNASYKNYLNYGLN